MKKPFTLKSFKKIVLLLFAAIFLIFLTCVHQNYKFKAFSDYSFQQEMLGDSLSMHYILAYPEHFSLPAGYAVLPVYDKSSQKEGLLRLQGNYNYLKQIHPVFLTPDSRRLYELLLDDLEKRIAESKFPYYPEPLSPASGMQTNLPILLAEYTFRDKRDVENYLSLLSQVPAYFDGLLQYEREKSKAGLFMPDSALWELVRQCSEIMEPRLIASNAHFLDTSFSERLEPLIAKQLLSEEEARSYQEQNHSLLQNAVRPAYKKMCRQLLLLEGTGKNTQGLARLPGGKEYYRFLFLENTGCSRSLSQVKALLLCRLREDTAAMTALLQKYPKLREASALDPFPSLSCEEMLEDLKKRMQKDFPPLPPGEENLSYRIKQVSPSLEKYCSPAFYMIPPIDDMSENSIYINSYTKPSNLELYTTLAHEGYPGHLYQTVYFQLYQQTENLHPLHNLFRCGGYVEGWALYVEMLSYDYAKELEKEAGAAPEDLAYYDLKRLSRNIQLCLYSILDLEIHYDGADYGSVSRQLGGFGINQPDTVKSIYQYIAQEPASYPKYYVGYLEFLELKKAAVKKWGKSYSDLKFHQYILETGPCPFEFLWKKLPAAAFSNRSPFIFGSL